MGITKLLSLIIFIIFTVCLGACVPKHSSYSDFRQLPITGWSRESPYYFTPEYADSLGVYGLKIAISHDNDYKYKDLALTVDLIKNDSSVERKIVRFNFADGNGNWSGSGFGALYQHEKMIIASVPAHSISRIIVWQGMNCDTLSHVANIGITMEPAEHN